VYHTASTIYKFCPQKAIDFYEVHLQFSQVLQETGLTFLFNSDCSSIQNAIQTN
jgi:hypothetical protein